jgi:S-adenosylmethionine hydrolase
LISPVISITTDFGNGDYDTGVLSGVILSIAPDAKIAELTHEITPFNILEGAVVLGRCAPYFPEGSIHICVVDPGVGTNRRGLAARLGNQLFVGPDNGLCTIMYQQAKTSNLPVFFYELNKPQYWLPEVTHIFHGRDVFAPVAAHLAAGVALEEIGSPIVDPVLLNIPEPIRIEKGWRGTILHIDHFGNLTSNLSMEQVSLHPFSEIRINQNKIVNLCATYGSGKPGELLALIDDSGVLEIAVSQGSAEDRLDASVGTEFELIFKE